MPTVCVDASLVLMLLLPDEHSEGVETLWSHWEQDQITLLGPPLLYAEVPSVLREAVFFGRIKPEEGERAFEAFFDMPIAISSRPDLHLLAWHLAKMHNRPKLYDSMYLAVAQAESCELWTGDRRLFNAVNLPWVKWIGEQQN